MDAIPSVHRIRLALEGIPGAIKDSPETEEAGESSNPGTPVLSLDPTSANPDLIAPTAMTPSEFAESEEIYDQPNLIFEVPPVLTDAEVRHVLGDRIGNLKRLAEVNGIDAYAWYVTFH